MSANDRLRSKFTCASLRALRPLGRAAMLAVAVTIYTTVRADLITLNQSAVGTLERGVFTGGAVIVDSIFGAEAALIWATPTFQTTENRGIVEFDLSLITPIPNATVNLVFIDSGGAGVGDSTTLIHWYTGTADGAVTTADWDSPATFFTSITRLFLGPPTTLDVTALVNSVGPVSIGFRFHALSIMGVTQADSFSVPHLEFDPNPVLVPGDANGDGCVSGADFTLWNDNFGAGPGATVADGDFTGDGFVTGGDFTVWADHFGEGCAPSQAVPEPSAVILAVLGLVLLARRVACPRSSWE